MKEATLGVEPSRLLGEYNLVLPVLLGRPIERFPSKSDGCKIDVHPNHSVDQFQVGGPFPRVSPTPSGHDGHHFRAEWLTCEVLEKKEDLALRDDAVVTRLCEFHKTWMSLRGGVPSHSDRDPKECDMSFLSRPMWRACSRV